MTDTPDSQPSTQPAAPQAAAPQAAGSQAAGPQAAGPQAAGADHTETETHGWTIDVPDHPGRQDSPEYVAARSQMNEIASQATGLIYGPGPFQDHHGGALWLKDAQGWFMVRNCAGVEWSAQFCADAAKVEVLSRPTFAGFPSVMWSVGQTCSASMEESRSRGSGGAGSQPKCWRRGPSTRPCYDLEFDDGTKIRASAEHRWLVSRGTATAAAQLPPAPRAG